MKLERFFSNSFLVALILCISSINVNAQFTAQGNGEWTNSATWGGSAPPATITGFTTISIPAAFTVTMDTNITVAASASLTVNGSLSDNANTHELEIESAGSLSGAGSIEVNEFTFNAVSYTHLRAHET